MILTDHLILPLHERGFDDLTQHQAPMSAPRAQAEGEGISTIETLFQPHMFPIKGSAFIASSRNKSVAWDGLT